MEHYNEIKRDYKIIFNSGIARHLLRDFGIPLADIKPDRTNPERTIFVFKRTPEFEIAFEQINKEISESKTDVVSE